ncbi:hypothetical protein O181_030133 [Austropuccinia psidii MF-1]|uniref:Fungal lipase-like domain-containing protein n=1 Tax=Austropuccinia psidii MF-1 TaxID=1389203 RepID=A0A9Q3H3E4_9BASI|nr:hypothetical protein [Austropuccinia psidii MF-1]
MPPHSPQLEKLMSLQKGFHDQETAKRYNSKLSSLQRSFLTQYAIDIEKTVPDSFWSTSYFRIEFITSFGYAIIIRFLDKISKLTAKPSNTLALIAYFFPVYGFLFCKNLVFLIAYHTGIDSLLTRLLKLDNAQPSHNNWIDPDHLVQNAHKVLTQKSSNLNLSPDFDRPQDSLQRSHFGPDIACLVSWMCTSLDKRDLVSFRQAKNVNVNSLEAFRKRELYLLKSEKLMHRIAEKSGSSFLSIPVTDYRRPLHLFTGFFYNVKVKQHHNPFVVIVIKGNSPKRFPQFFMNFSAKIHGLKQFLSTQSPLCDFYNTLFPSRSSQLALVPYGKIVNAVKLIAHEATNRSGVEAKLNLFIAGHSAGAGIAKFLYAKFLNNPKDLGDKIVLRDCYALDTPLAEDFVLASNIRDLNELINHDEKSSTVSKKPLFRKGVNTDILPSVSNRRQITFQLQPPNSLFNPTIETHLTIEPKSEEIGHEVAENCSGFEANDFNKLICNHKPPTERMSLNLGQFSKFLGIMRWFITPAIPFLHTSFQRSFLALLTKLDIETPNKNTWNNENMNPEFELDLTPKSIPNIFQNNLRNSIPNLLKRAREKETERANEKYILETTPKTSCFLNKIFMNESSSLWKLTQSANREEKRQAMPKIVSHLPSLDFRNQVILDCDVSICENGETEEGKCMYKDHAVHESAKATLDLINEKKSAHGLHLKQGVEAVDLKSVQERHRVEIPKLTLESMNQKFLNRVPQVWEDAPPREVERTKENYRTEKNSKLAFGLTNQSCSTSSPHSLNSVRTTDIIGAELKYGVTDWSRQPRVDFIDHRISCSSLHIWESNQTGEMTTNENLEDMLLKPVLDLKNGRSSTYSHCVLKSIQVEETERAYKEREMDEILKLHLNLTNQSGSISSPRTWEISPTEENQHTRQNFGQDGISKPYLDVLNERSPTANFYLWERFPSKTLQSLEAKSEFDSAPKVSPESRRLSSAVWKRVNEKLRASSGEKVKSENGLRSKVKFSKGRIARLWRRVRKSLD